MRTPPHNADAERSVLGAIMLDGEGMGLALEHIQPDDFYSKSHGVVFSAMCCLYESGGGLDGVSVAEELERSGALDAAGGNDYLADIVASIGSSANISHHAKIVRDKAILRGLISAGGQVVESAFDGDRPVDEILDAAQAVVFGVADRRSAGAFHSLGDVVPDVYRSIDDASKGGKTGIQTGFRGLDWKTGGLQDSDLIILASRPSMGKTALALNIAYHAAVNEQTPVAFFSLEMSKEQLCTRLLCASGGFNGHDLRLGRLERDQWARLAGTCAKISNAPIFIDDSSGMTGLELKAKARRMKRQHNIGLIVIDYMQLMSGHARAENRQQEISVISRNLKGIAKDLHVPVLALSQLSRAVEARSDHRPLLSDLRESGSIEQDADVVLFLFREEYYKPDDDTVRNRATLIVGKQRNGPIGDIDLHFHKAFARFGNLQEAGREE